MQYDSIEELMLELALYPNKKLDILKDCASKCQYDWGQYGWFVVAKDGNCALFDDNGELDDINKIKSLNQNMVVKLIEKINIPSSVKFIGKNAFNHQEYLKNAMIPDSVKSIEDQAFANCYRLIEIAIPDSVEYIGESAFRYCINLEDITISNKLVRIEDFTFAEGSRFKSLDIPDNVKSIGQYAFYRSKLEKITIGCGIMYIGFGAFTGCRLLSEMTFKGKTLDQVKSLKNYPWGIEDESIIKCEG